MHAGTGGLNVPMFIALRRFTLLCTIVLERVMMAKRHDRSTIGAVGIMIVGARRRCFPHWPGMLLLGGWPACKP